MVEFQHLLQRLSKSLQPVPHDPTLDLPLDNRAAQGSEKPASSNEYKYTGVQRSASYSIIPLGSDYAAFLAICALKCWLAPPLLAEVSSISALWVSNLSLASHPFLSLQAVTQVEGAFVDAECQVAYEFDVVEQDRLRWISQQAEELK